MGFKYWKDIKNKGRTPEQIAKLDAEVQAELTAMSLRDVREASGLTQTELAADAEMTQSELSKVERRQDMKVSTVRRYVEALGGELELCAVMGNKRITLHL